MEINKLGLAAGTEFLDMVTGQYISDLDQLGRYWRSYHRKPST